MYASSQYGGTPCQEVGGRGYASQSRLESVAAQEIALPYSGEGKVAYAISAPVLGNDSIGYPLSSSLGSLNSLGASPVFGYLGFHSQLSLPLHSYSFQSFSSGYKKNPELETNQHFSTPSHVEYHFNPEEFLKPGKGGKFVGQAEEVRAFVEEAFEKMFNCPFPEDIKISVCDEKEFRILAPHPGTIGLSINRRTQGLLSEIFVLHGSLARVLLTVGHELGHVFTQTLNHAPDEEAKAYAFSMAWMEVIKEYDVAHLRNAFFSEMPAQNGLHDVAFAFVSRLLQQGQKAWTVWEMLVKEEVSVGG